MNNSETAVFLTNAIADSGMTQKEIALQIGYNRPNVLSMMKLGDTKVPISKIPDIARVCRVDEFEFLRTAMQEYHPEIWTAIEQAFEKKYRHGECLVQAQFSEIWFVMRPGKAQAFGRPTGNRSEFLVKAGSTAMANGSSTKKRDREERERLVRQGVLAVDRDPDLYRFTRDHTFNSASLAGGIIKDGNCSGPQSWKNERSGQTLKDWTES